MVRVDAACAVVASCQCTLLRRDELVAKSCHCCCCLSCLSVGADPSDWFNYGFNEEAWKAYCQKQKTLREEYQLQSKIKVGLDLSHPQSYGPSSSCAATLGLKTMHCIASVLNFSLG